MEATSYRQLIRLDLLTVLTSPIIYSLIFPAIILDIFVSLYQAVCFPVYGIKKVDRSKYILLDRHRLPYLSFVQKINCLYCGYFNGLIAYVREIASRTEQYWCPIKHALKAKKVHKRYENFAEYNNERDFRSRRDWLRESLGDKFFNF